MCIISGVGTLLNNSKIIMNYFRPLLPYFLVLLVLLSTSIFLEMALLIYLDNPFFLPWLSAFLSGELVA
jgi:hypothetical protein